MTTLAAIKKMADNDFAANVRADRLSIDFTGPDPETEVETVLTCPYCGRRTFYLDPGSSSQATGG